MTSRSLSTRRFELGLPLFAGLDLGLILQSQEKIAKQEFEGLTSFIKTLGETGQLRTIRKLSAIWTATEIELEMAENDPKIMKSLEDNAAKKMFSETFNDAMTFVGSLWEQLGLHLGSSVQAPEATPEDKPKKPRKTKEATPSEG